MRGGLASLLVALVLASCRAGDSVLGQDTPTATPPPQPTAAPTSTPTPTSPPTRTPSPSPTAAPTPSPPATPAARAPTLVDLPVQTGLVVPWDLAFAPDGRMFVTERAGNVLVFASGQPNAPRLGLTAIPDMRAQGESGLMGIALDPRFATNRFVYLCASRTDQGQWLNQVLRYREANNVLAFDGYVIREGMRAAAIHDGCSLRFGPDGKLWITMGDSSSSRLAQDASSLNGKILRLNGDGTVPEDNPVMPGASARTAVYTMGNRNPQGIAFQPSTGIPFEVEHGATTHDEINVLRAGANYGWPTVEGPGGTFRGFVDPVWSSGSVTLATSGGTFVTGANWGTWSGSLIVATLKESDLRRFAVQGTAVTEAEVLLDGKYGRLRTPVLGPAGALYVTTSNGQGDRIVRITASR